MKSYRMMYSNIGLTCRETLPLTLDLLLQAVLLVRAGPSGVRPEGLGRQESGRRPGGVPQVSSPLIKGIVSPPFN